MTADVCRVELETRLLALFAKMGFAASSMPTEHTSSADLGSLVSAISVTRQACAGDAGHPQGLQGALLADSMLSRCRAEDTQLIKVRSSHQLAAHQRLLLRWWQHVQVCKHLHGAVISVHESMQGRVCSTMRF